MKFGDLRTRTVFRTLLAGLVGAILGVVFMGLLTRTNVVSTEAEARQDPTGVLASTIELAVTYTRPTIDSLKPGSNRLTLMSCYVTIDKKIKKECIKETTAKGSVHNRYYSNVGLEWNGRTMSGCTVIDGREYCW